MGSDSPAATAAPQGRGAAARGGAKGGPKPAPERSGRGRVGARAAPVSSTPRSSSATATGTRTSPRSSPPKTFPGAEQEGERLQKILARAGMGSRRACEELIEQARVEVNGEIVLEQGMRVDPRRTRSRSTA